MKSQLLVRLEAELDVVDDPLRRARALVKIGCYFARIGKFSEAKAIVRKLRDAFGDGRSGHVTAQILLLEGIILLFEELSPVALDKVSRSQVLGLGMKDPAVIAISSAWKAHLEFEFSKYTAMGASLQLALHSARQDDHDAMSRVSIIFCNCFLICGDSELAQHWFLKSRQHALADGDQAAIDALLYNKVAFHLGRLRAARCLQSVELAELQLVKIEIASAKNLQSLMKVEAVQNFVLLCEARLEELLGNFSVAIDKLQLVRRLKPFADHNFDQAVMDLEVFYCLHKLGQAGEASPGLWLRVWECLDRLDVDEVLVATNLVTDLALHGVHVPDVERWKARMSEAATQYQRQCASLLALLQGLDLGCHAT